MKKLILASLICAFFGSCSSEMMGSMNHEFTPFGKPIEKNKEMKSSTIKPDESIQMPMIK